MTSPDAKRPDVHGHRGCRGLLPENTIPAFLRATELGCDRLELDVVVNADGAVVVSHEPWMEHRICLDPVGQRISAAQERDHNIYRMSTADLLRYDCGSLQHPDFPQQRNGPTHKPLLQEVVIAVRSCAERLGIPEPGFTVEIKSEPELYGTHQPQPVAFASFVIEDLRLTGIQSTCIVQSFDPEVLKAIRSLSPDPAIALLVDNSASLEVNLARLSFTPEIYSPRYKRIDEKLLRELRDRNIGIAAWTVNGEADMQRMIALGVDGIITDYPDRLIALLAGV
ncbi:MAG: glycerophosphodiester phosphodiesterase family protein [Flavobacteriales bacterium]